MGLDRLDVETVMERIKAVVLIFGFNYHAYNLKMTLLRMLALGVVKRHQ